MKFKKLLVLIVVLALLAGASLLKKADLEKSRSGAPALSQTTLLAGQSFSTGFVTKADIHRGTPGAEQLVLTKDASGLWTLQSPSGMNVRKESVESFLKLFNDLRGELRAEDKAVLGDFELTDEKAFHIELFGSAGNALAHVLVSPLRPRGTQNFVRLSGADKVVATDTDVLASLGIFSKEDKLNARSFADPAPPPSVQSPKTEKKG